MSSVHPITPYLVAAVGVAISFGWLMRRNPSDSLPLPPGPKPLPVIGNLLDMPKEKDWVTYRYWNERYGEVACVKALGWNIVVLSSPDVINELLERRSAIYSSRPSSVMVVDLYDCFSLCLMVSGSD
jgi:hypothetical protein